MNFFICYHAFNRESTGMQCTINEGPFDYWYFPVSTESESSGPPTIDIVLVDNRGASRTQTLRRTQLTISTLS